MTRTSTTTRRAKHRTDADHHTSRLRRLLPGKADVKHWALQIAQGLPVVAFAIGHAVLLLWLQYRGTQQGAVNWPAVLAPVGLTLIVLPSAWRFWRRWAVLYFIVFICNPVLFPQVLVVAETYVLYTIWVRDRDPGDLDFVKRLPAVIFGRFRSAKRGAEGSVGTAGADGAEGVEDADSPADAGDSVRSADSKAPRDDRPVKAKNPDPRAKTGPTPKRPKKAKKTYPHVGAA